MRADAQLADLHGGATAELCLPLTESRPLAHFPVATVALPDGFGAAQYSWSFSAVVADESSESPRPVERIEHTPMTSRHALAADRPLLNKVPEITLYFWLIKVLCTTVGETAADFLNVNLNFGLVGTSVVTGVLLIGAMAVQFAARCENGLPQE